MFASLQFALRRSARRAGASITALLMVLVGLGFLTSALWMLLEEMRDALFAATVIGALYLGVGLILMAFLRRPPPRRPVAPPPEASAAGLSAALMQGVSAGMAAGAASRRPAPDRPAPEDPQRPPC